MKTAKELRLLLFGTIEVKGDALLAKYANWLLEQQIATIQADALETAACLGERNDPYWAKHGWAAAIRALNPKSHDGR